MRHLLLKSLASSTLLLFAVTAGAQDRDRDRDPDRDFSSRQSRNANSVGAASTTPQ
jgi:hypothetical protein